MKNILKIGFLAMALGLFVAACNGTGNNNNNDSTTVDSMAAPMPVTPAPVDTMGMPEDTTGADTAM